MNHPAAQAVVNPDYQSKASTQLQGSWLVLARIPWIFLALFPSGRFVPSFTRWLVVAWLVVAMPAIFWLNSSVNLLDWTGVLEVLLIAGIMVALVIAQGYRYWRISSPVQRQQTKWIVF